MFIRYSITAPLKGVGVGIGVAAGVGVADGVGVTTGADIGVGPGERSEPGTPVAIGALTGALRGMAVGTGVRVGVGVGAAVGMDSAATAVFAAGDRPAIPGSRVGVGIGTGVGVLSDLMRSMHALESATASTTINRPKTRGTIQPASDRHAVSLARCISLAGVKCTHGAAGV